MSDGLIGKRFGKLIVKSFNSTQRSPGGHSYKTYDIVCDCGTKCVMVLGNLKRSVSCKYCRSRKETCLKICQYCGKKYKIKPYRKDINKYCSTKCWRKDKSSEPEKLNGFKFGKYTVSEFVKTKNGQHYHNCICACGTNQLYSENDIKNHRIRQCRKCADINCGKLRQKDISGQVFEKLLVLSRTKTENGKSKFKCLCECGNISSYSLSNLQGGGSTQCRKCRVKQVSDDLKKPIIFIDGIKHKECCACKILTPLTNFHKLKENKLTSECKGCGNKRKQLYDREHFPTYLKKKISQRIRMMFKNTGLAKANNKTLEILGCSKEQFKQHIVGQFKDGMTEDNRKLWHIDHIIPVDWYLKQLPKNPTEEQILEAIYKANHYSNLQPLWAKDNLAKSNKIMGVVVEQAPTEMVGLDSYIKDKDSNIEELDNNSRGQLVNSGGGDCIHNDVVDKTDDRDSFLSRLDDDGGFVPRL